MPGFFTSLTFAGLGDWLRHQQVDGPVTIIGNASRELEDRDVIAGMADAELRGITTRHVDVSADGPEALRRAGAVVMTGGDPFRLLADLRASGADRLLLDADARRVPIAGQSAGAIVCAPSLEPIRITSPFRPPAGLDLRGLGITDTVILPHQDRPGRAALHRRAALAFSEDFALTPLWDDEVLLTGDGAWCIVRGERRTRVATQDDAEAVADVFHAAAQQAWGAFLGEDRLARADKDLDDWAQSIAIGGRRFLVTEDNSGLVGFVSYHRAAGHGDGPPTGKVDLLYTHPRARGNGTGRRLLERATWQLLCEGVRAAVLWTEARNERALAVYRQGGWIPDGAVDQRDYLGVPIRNLRHHIDLTRHAGGD